MTLEYTHNDEVAEMLYQKERELHAIIYAKDQEIRVLKDALAFCNAELDRLEQRIEKIRTSNFYAVEEMLNDGF